jgi:hypothetical protein
MKNVKNNMKNDMRNDMKHGIKNVKNDLKKKKITRKILRFCPINELINLKSGLTIIIYDSKSKSSKIITLQGRTLERISLFFGLKKHQIDINLLGNKILLHANNLFRVHCDKINGDSSFADFELDFQSGIQGPRSGIMGPKSVLGIHMDDKDIREKLRKENKENNDEIEKEGEISETELREKEGKEKKILNLGLSGPSKGADIRPQIVPGKKRENEGRDVRTVRDGKCNYVMNNRQQKLNAARSFLLSMRSAEIAT